MGGMRKMYRISVRKPERKTNWQIMAQINYVTREFREIGYEGMDWIQLAQVVVQWRALVNTVINFWFHRSQ
jgi:hypothetical protein